MPKCTICHHPQRHDLDCALLAENATYSALSQQYGPSISAIFRHKKHLQEKMRQTEKRLQNNLLQGCLFQFNEFLETTRHLNRTAVADGDARRAVQVISAGTRILNFITKLDVKLDQNTVYRVLANPQWTSQDSLLPTDPQIITGSHQALADNLFFPCPEPEPRPASLDDEVDDEADFAGDEDDDEAEIPETEPLQTQNSAPETLALLQEVLPSLIRSQLKPRQTADHKPKNQREISAKSARKTSPLKHNNDVSQLDKVCKKNTRKNSLVGRESDAPLANSPLETQNSAPETPQPESLFVRLRRKWAQTAPASKYSCDSEQLYEEYLQEKAAAGVPDTLPEDPGPEPAPAAAHQPPDNPNPQPETPNSAPETPQPEAPPARKPLNPFTHPKEYYFALEHGYRIEDTPKHKPDRRWEEDFGNPRRNRGGY